MKFIFFYDHIILNKKKRRIYILRQRMTWVFTRNGLVVVSFDGLKRRGGSELWCGSVKILMETSITSSSSSVCLLRSNWSQDRKMMHTYLLSECAKYFFFINSSWDAMEQKMICSYQINIKSFWRMESLMGPSVSLR